jgi:crotonobetainyl-CoA:carnitine CoA-transferase CaiB-like acyl-CoA transferase
VKPDLGAAPTGPLAGIRVVDVTTVVSGPLCTQILGDMGADVIKVEAPGGESARRMGLPMTAGISPLFAQCNRNKRSLAVDLKQARGAAVVARLAAAGDVFVANYRPGVADRLGLGYEALSAANPRLVYAAISGFGPDGPYRDLPAYDTVIQGLSGFMPVQGGGGGPQLVQMIAADKVTALTAVYGILGALFARERGDAAGQRVDVPMIDAYAAFVLPDILGERTFPDANAPPFPAIHRTWATADGFVVMMIIEDDQFAGVCRALDRPDVAENPKYAGLIQRIVHVAEIFATLEAEIVKWPTAEFVARARANGAPVAPANEIDDFLADPQVVHNATIVETELDTELGRTRYVRLPVRFERTPASFRRLPPRLGEHTSEILREAGYSDADVASLVDGGVVS